jgi:nucleoside-diphosphate-sugar epimerase
LQNYEAMKNRPYNVGLSSANLSKWELCQVIKRHVAGLCVMQADLGEDPDKRNYVVSNERIEGTGYLPAVGLDEGIQELIRGYTVLRSNPYSNQ